VATLQDKAFILLPRHKLNFSLLWLLGIKKLHSFLLRHISFPATLYPIYQIRYPASSLHISFRALPLLNGQERKAETWRPESLWFV